MGSQSFVGAIGTAISLRSADKLSVFLLLFWALSPLGGQSNLHLLRETNSTTSVHGTVYYAAPEAPFVLQHASPWYSVVLTILTASLAASGAAKNGLVDLWNHPKTPRLQSVELAKAPSTDEKQDWVSVNNYTKLDYSSWTGVNIQGLEPGKRSKFRIKYNYLVVDCGLRLRAKPKTVLELLTQPSTNIYSPIPGKNSNESESISSAYNRLLNGTLYLQSHDIPFQNSYFFKYSHNDTSSGNSTMKAGSAICRILFASYTAPIHLAQTCSTFMNASRSL